MLFIRKYTTQNYTEKKKTLAVRMFSDQLRAAVSLAQKDLANWSPFPIQFHSIQIYWQPLINWCFLNTLDKYIAQQTISSTRRGAGNCWCCAQYSFNCMHNLNLCAIFRESWTVADSRTNRIMIKVTTVIVNSL